MEQEPLIRLGVFAATAVLLGVCETLLPRRQRTLHRRKRWSANLGLMAADALVLRVCFPAAAVGVALFAREQAIGLFHYWQPGGAVTLVAGLLALDLAIYWQHRLFHRVPWLWRLHKVHHTDLEVDVSTAVRFHPAEILLSMLIKAAVILTLGLGPVTVLAFEILLSSASLFNHTNIGIPPRLDAVLRRVLVTPDMHRVHHSTRREETDSNFGFSFSWWDRLFASYRNQPADGHRAMNLGLPEYRQADRLGLWYLLRLPVTKQS